MSSPHSEIDRDRLGQLRNVASIIASILTSVVFACVIYIICLITSNVNKLKSQYAEISGDIRLISDNLNTTVDVVNCLDYYVCRIENHPDRDHCENKRKVCEKEYS